MTEYLKSKYFDIECVSALLCARNNENDDEDLKSPFLTLKIERYWKNVYHKARSGPSY